MSEIAADREVRKLLFLRPRSDEDQAWRHGSNGDTASRDQRQRVDQRIDAFDGAKLSDIKQFGRVGIVYDRGEFGGPNTIDDKSDQPVGIADFFAKAFADEGTFKQEEVGGACEYPLDAHKTRFDNRMRSIVEAAAMRCIGANRSAAPRHQAGQA